MFNSNKNLTLCCKPRDKKPSITLYSHPFSRNLFTFKNSKTTVNTEFKLKAAVFSQYLAHTKTCIHLRMYIYMHVRTYTCICVKIYIHIYVYCMRVYTCTLYICIYMYVCICMFIYVYMYAYTTQRTLTMFVGVVALRYQHHLVWF